MSDDSWDRSAYKYSENWGHQVAFRDSHQIPWIFSYVLVDGKWENVITQTIPAAMDR